MAAVAAVSVAKGAVVLAVADGAGRASGLVAQVAVEMRAASTNGDCHV